MTPDGQAKPAPAHKPFSFFPHRPFEIQDEGRDPHALIRDDPLARQFPTSTHIGIALFCVSLVLYLATMSWTAFPGLPTRMLATHLKLEFTPPATDSLWGLMVRVATHLPGLALPGWMGLASAVCGAASVALLGRLVMRVGYVIRNEPGVDSLRREAQARRLSGLVSGLFLAFCVPFWVASTRSLPATFHVLLLLSAAWFFSQYQLWGKRRHLLLLGFLYGAGITEFPTFIVFLPLAVFLAARETFRWKAWSRWTDHLALWGGTLAGLSLYAFNAYVLYRRGLPLELYDSPMAAWIQIARDQLALIFRIQYHPGFLVVMFLSLVPWLTLFAMSRRSPWFYERGQVAVRLILAVGLLAVLYNATFSPWNLIGMGYLMVTPYVLLAVCMGYMVGEFWILGEINPLVDLFWNRHVFRRISSVFTVVLMLAVAGGVAHNWRIADGRPGAAIDKAAAEILDRLEGRDFVFSSGMLDDSLRLAIWTRRAPVFLVSAPRTSSPTYLKLLSYMISGEALSGPLREGNFGLFLENLMMSATGPGRTSIVDLPDVFREFGYLAPDGFLYRLEKNPGAVDVPALAERQKPFWDRMALLAERPAPEQNPVRPYQDVLCLMVSKVANNLGVMQAERGDEAAAVETFRAARRIYPENASVFLNLLELARRRGLPEEAEWEAEWTERLEKLGGDRWALGVRHGYVWNAREWVRRGRVWAMSGSPETDEGARLKPPKPEEESDGAMERMDKAYLLWGRPIPPENYYRGLLMRDGRDTGALMSLCQLSLRRGDAEAAAAYLEEALAMGLPEDEVAFDRAMIDLAQGEKDKAMDQLDALARSTPGDLRLWMAFVLLKDAEDPASLQAVKTLQGHPTAGPEVWLSLASVFMERLRWAEAKAELEKAIHQDSKNAQAWEMMMLVSQELGDNRLRQASMRALLARDPNHYLRFQNQGVEYYAKGEFELAEKAFRDGIRRKRNPVLMNNLADVLIRRGGDLQEALSWVDEALRRQPGNVAMLSTRAEVLMNLDRFAEARADLQQALTLRGRDVSMLVMLARCYEKEGDRDRALKVAKALARNPGQLDAGQKAAVRDMLLRLR
ncbi:MAG: tetratricopeptide repeat protein [Kiritimatiellia bacterium]